MKNLSVTERQLGTAWQASTCSKQAFTVELKQNHLDAFDDLLNSVRGLEPEEITPAKANLNSIQPDLHQWNQVLRYGAGLLILSRFPQTRYNNNELAQIYWSIGLHFGIPMSQSVAGDRLGHVIGIGGKDYSERAYRSRVELDMHTDACDIVGMLCLQKAKSGGISGYASAVAIYREILTRRPDLLPLLTRGFYYHLFGEQAPGEPPVTTDRLPVFSASEGYLTVHYLRAFIEFAAQEHQTPLTDRENEALNLFDEIAHSEEFALRFTTEPGEAVFFNNATVLHNRTAFDDHPEASRKRHLLRLWLTAHQPLPKHELLQRYTKHGIPQQEHDGTPFEHDFTFNPHR